MNKLSIQDRAAILNALSEGVGINAASRMAGKSKNTILKLLADVGEACALYQDRVMNNLPYKLVQVDEIWSFVSTKQKNVTEDHPGLWGARERTTTSTVELVNSVPKTCERR